MHGVITMEICAEAKHFLRDTQCCSDTSVQTNMSSMTGPTSLITVDSHAVLLLEQESAATLAALLGCA